MILLQSIDPETISANDSLLSEPIVAAIIGGLIAGTFTVIATVLSFRHQRKQQAEIEAKNELSLLQAIYSEIDILWSRYNEGIGQFLESLDDGQPFLRKYPMFQDYFPVYRRNTAHIVRIQDNVIQRLIVSIYTKATGLVDSIINNNELVDKYESRNQMFNQSNQIHQHKTEMTPLQDCVNWAQVLKQYHKDVKADIAILFPLLKEKGIRIDQSANISVERTS